MKYLVTGAAGFIGYHVSAALLEAGHDVHGIDGMTDYYDPQLKRDRLARLSDYPRFEFTQGRIEDEATVEQVLSRSKPAVILHLAAQAGVRYSLEAPLEYVRSNVIGTTVLAEAVRAHAVEHLVFASTSSVYGGNVEFPFSEGDGTDYPQSIYAATKRSGEAILHSYSHLFSIPTTAVRFFTVYGPWGRPDMALFKFVQRVLEGNPIEVYGDGLPQRDFTFINDLVESLLAIAVRPPRLGEPVGQIDTLSPVAPFRIVNAGRGQIVGLGRFIRAVEAALRLPAEKVMLPMQPGDVMRTEADTRLLAALTGTLSATPIEHGVVDFVNWYRAYYDV